MRKYFNENTIFILILFVLESINVYFCITHTEVGKFATCFAMAVDFYIFYMLIMTLKNSK